MPMTVTTCATLSEAQQVLRETPRAKFFGGGTLMMRWMNEADQSFDAVVRSTDQSAFEIKAEGDRIVLGSGVTMAQIARERGLEFMAPVAKAVGGPAVRTAATVGGNLFAHHPYGDFTVALLALGAEVTLADGQTHDLEAFLQNRDRAGIVSSVSFERPRSPSEFRWHKVSRVKPKGISVMSMAAHLPHQGGRITNSRVAYGAMAPTPIRVRAVEAALNGQMLSEQGIGQAVDAAIDGLSPPDDPIASAWYRREVAPVHLKRMLLEAR
ncbi:MAG: FAD binding domain-containing protein [Pseudomonadota bacterium]